jgi:phosphatidylglycerophosphatase A
LRFALTHPAHFIALGFGAGLVQVAPGTFGTLLALALHLAIFATMPPEIFAIVWCAGFAVGTWACEVTGRHLGVHDHGAMVWDEVMAFLLVLFFTPALAIWQALAFLLFRLFDIAKPPPIHRAELAFPNGFGVMFDDLIAGFYALLAISGWKFAFA